jgi:hypothetical protein
VFSRSVFLGKTTFYELMKRQPGVSERYKKGKAKAISEVAEGLLTKAREGDTASTIFYQLVVLLILFLV